ncbi:hypothetical protein [Desulfosporosinus youngiae]|uniref:hypothetical protein n=1 Tax=Desulfosporosinus youngiae TaxID=339862 RepID=UPI0003009304|nr:hypothetical protein [Desulfosporosinus youngiae]
MESLLWYLLMGNANGIGIIIFLSIFCAQSWRRTGKKRHTGRRNKTKGEVKRITEAFLKIKKLDIAAIEKARLG